MMSSWLRNARWLLVYALTSACAYTAYLKVTELESGSFSGRERAVCVVQDAEQFSRLYGELHEDRLSIAPPDIEFEVQMLIVAFMGTKPSTGYGIKVAGRARLMNRVLVVTLVERVPGASTLQGAVMTSPYVLASVERGGYDQISIEDTKGRVIQNLSLNSGLEHC